MLEASFQIGKAMTNRFESTQQDLGRTFAHPEDISAARDLSAALKVKLLQEWEYDLRLMQVGSRPSMWCNFWCGPEPSSSGGLGCNL